MNQGKPLGEFVNSRIFVGLKTGLNEAFVIEQAKRDELIEEDPNSAELIKPYLKGRDIKRWHVEQTGLFAIAIQSSSDLGANHPWSKEKSVEKARDSFRETFPAIWDHMRFFEKGLYTRSDQGKFWWELRSCTYYHEFAVPKIIWPNIAREVRFGFDDCGMYTDMTCFFTPTNSMWLLAVLNSKLAKLLLCQITNTVPGGFMEMKTQYMSRLPIITPNQTKQRKLAAIARSGITGRVIDEDQYNGIVYDLYGLSPAEVRLVEGWFERRSLDSSPRVRATVQQ